MRFTTHHNLLNFSTIDKLWLFQLFSIVNTITIDILYIFGYTWVFISAGFIHKIKIL